GPECAAIFRRSTPRFKRNPRKKLSSKAAAADTTVFSKGEPATYFSRESAAAKRTASAPTTAEISMECASTPKPKYGWRVQYFKLCCDSKPVRAKFEISYC